MATLAHYCAVHESYYIASFQLQSPGPIDNSALTEPSSPGALRRHLIDEMDFVLVPANVYAVLKEMYGTTGPEFPRKVSLVLIGGIGNAHKILWFLISLYTPVMCIGH